MSSTVWLAHAGRSPLAPRGWASHVFPATVQSVEDIWKWVNLTLISSSAWADLSWKMEPPGRGEEKLQSARVPSEEWEGSLPWAGQLLWEHGHHRGCRFVFSAAGSKTLHRWIQQVLVEWVLSIQRRIFTLPAGGNTAGELQISGYWIEHGTKQNTEWNGTRKTEVIVKNNRSKPLQMRLQIQRTHWEREIIMENSNLQNHILMKLPYSV